MIITYYPNIESYTPSYFLLWELPSLLISGTTKESFEKFKSGKITKEQLPIIVASGQVEPGKKTNQNVKLHSGLILLDLDKKDNPDIERKIRDINNDKFTYFSFRSPNGGYKVGVYTSIRDIKEHSEYYDAISNYYSSKYSISCDNRCRNICRFCFLPYDENSYNNPCSEKFTLKKGTNDLLIFKREISKRDNNVSTTNYPISSIDSKSVKINTTRCVSNFSVNPLPKIRDSSTYNNETDFNIDSLIQKGVYADIIFNSYRYKYIMSIPDLYYQSYIEQKSLDYFTKIDESNFSDNKSSYYVKGGIPVCQIRLSKTFKIKTGSRNRTLGSISLKLIFNNPFALHERIQQEILFLNEKYCEEPLFQKECRAIVKYNYDRFLTGNLDFSKVIRHNKNGISRQFVFFSQDFKIDDINEKHKIACQEYSIGKKDSMRIIILNAIDKLKDGIKITIPRIAKLTGYNEKTIDRNLTDSIREQYKTYNKSIKLKDRSNIPSFQ